jgi:hypothetical protein
MQLTYNLFPGSARAGLLYDLALGADIVTRTAAAQAVPFGSFLVKDTGDGNVLLPSAAPSASSFIEGVAVYSQFTQSGLAGDGVTPGVEAGKPINVLRKGRIWVYCETSFNPDTDTLYVRYTANGAGLVPGQVRKDTDGGKAAQLGVSGWLVSYEALNTLTAAGYLALDLDIPATVR